jgi:hypothetical protein
VRWYGYPDKYTDEYADRNGDRNGNGNTDRHMYAWRRIAGTVVDGNDRSGAEIPCRRSV